MNHEPAERKIIFDGVDLETGRPTVPAMEPAAIGRRLLERFRVQPAADAPLRAFPIVGGPRAWHLVVPPGLDPDVRQELERLRARRDGQVLPYQGELDWLTWEERLHDADLVPPGHSDYLLLAGGPDAIPYDFEKMLTPDFVVGRLHLPDAAAYKRYVQGVLDHEDGKGPAGLRRTAVDFFATDDTDATLASADELVAGLAGDVNGHRGVYTAHVSRGAATDRASVLKRLGSYAPEGAPAVLFLASHGAEVGRELRAQFQGSWIPQGAFALGKVPDAATASAAFLTGDDFASGERSPHGSVVFNFACFGAGLHQEFTLRQWLMADEITPDDDAPLVSSLGQQLLGNPRPALAYISTLDRAGNVFSWPGGYTSFQQALVTLLDVPDGHAAGDAVRFFAQRGVTHRQSADQLLEEAIQSGQKPDDLELETARKLGLNWWLAEVMDNFVLLGDPAVALSRLQT